MPDFPIPAELFPWLAAVVGLCLGSFYSVCSHRYLEGTSIVRPPSRCPACGHRLGAWELLPLVGYLLLRGRCRACKTRISPLYPAHELVSGLWALLLALRFGPTWLFLFYLAMGGLFIVASMIDLQSFILPNRLTLPAALLALAGALVFPKPGLSDALIGAAVGYGMFWLLARLYLALKGVDGLGGGDVKLMLSIGALVGWRGLPHAILLASLSALAVSPFFFSSNQEKSSIPIPFGPFLCLGAMVQILYGRDIAAFLGAL